MQRFKLDPQLQNAFNSAGIGMAMTSLEGQWLSVNAALCRMLGYSEAQLLQKSFVDITPFEEREVDLKARDRMLSGEIQTHQREKHYLQCDGQPLWIQLNVCLLKDEDGIPIYFFAQVQNISDRKTAEKSLSESVATIVELSELIDQHRDSFVLLDIHGRIRLWNQGAEKLFGWTSTEAIGRKSIELCAAELPAVDTSIKHLLLQGFRQSEVERLDKAGKAIFVSSRSTLMKDAEGTPKSILVISTDLTEEKKNRAARLRSQRLESIGTLAGGIAHDLNNVLTPIMMGVELLSTGETDASRLRLIQTLASCSKRGAEMIKQLLSFARGVDGLRAEIQPAVLLSELERITNDTFLKNLKTEFSIAPDLRSVLGDSTQLQQVLLNLAVNSRDAMASNGKLIIKAENVLVDELEAGISDCAPGVYVCISVEDNGAGMPKEVLERVFEPFFTTKEVGKGTGLGLSTSLAIIKSHNGFMKVYSERDIGTKFNVYLPALLSETTPREIGTKAVLPRGSGECILVVDDELAVRMMTSQILEAFGYKSRVAADGVEALAIYKEHWKEIAVVITDMMMPRMNGIALIRSLNEINPAVRVIAASGLASHEDAISASRFLSKPYTAEAILNAVHECIEGQH